MSTQRKERAEFDHAMAELQEQVDAWERLQYSAAVIAEASQPSNLGRMEDADVHGMVEGWCGDAMEIYLRLDGDTIEEATFATNGCGPTVACGSKLTSLVTGRTLEEASQITPEALDAALDGLPESHVHCATLAVSTLQNALFNLRAGVEGLEQGVGDGDDS